MVSPVAGFSTGISPLGADAPGASVAASDDVCAAASAGSFPLTAVASTISCSTCCSTLAIQASQDCDFVIAETTPVRLARADAIELFLRLLRQLDRGDADRLGRGRRAGRRERR